MTNRELRAAAQELGRELGVDVGNVERMNNPTLVALVDTLRAQQEARQGAQPTVTAEREATPAEPEAEQPVPPESPTAPALAAVEPKPDPLPNTRPMPRPVPPPTPAETVDKPPPFRAFSYEVAQGRSITTRRGMIHGGAPVRPGDFRPETIEHLIKIGAIVVKH